MKADYEELERILTQELGDSNDYKREYGDTPFDDSIFGVY